MQETILLIIVVLGAAALIYWGYKSYTDKKHLKKALSLVFLKVLIPQKESEQDERKEGSQSQTFKDVVAVMEHLLASLHEMEKGDYISLEYAVLNKQVYFYVVVPYELQELVEKQITSYYADAVVEVEEDFNIFTENSVQEATALTLKKQYTYPLRTYQALESDPLNNLTNSLSKLNEDEGALIQILIKPENGDWQDKVKKLAEDILADKEKKPFSVLGFLKWFGKMLATPADKQDEAKRTTPLTEETVKAVETKSTKAGYRTIIRVVTSAPRKSEAKSSLQNIVNAFVQFSHPRMNTIVKSKYCNSKKILKMSIYRLFKKCTHLENDVILSTEEIAGLFHFPHNKFNKSAAIKWQKFKMAPPPENMPKEGILLGHTTYRGTKKDVRVQGDDRFRHFYIIGQTGTGKSTILQSMIKQDLKLGNGLCVVDPHGDLVKDVLPYIPRERADDVIIFDPADTERPLGLNLLEADTQEEQELIALDAMNMMIKLFGPEIFGPRIQDYFRNGVLTLMADPEGGALTDVMTLFVNEDFQKKKVSHLKNAVVKAWWDNTFAKMGDREKAEIIPYFSAKFGQFTTNSTMRNIIGQVKSSFDFSEAMQEGKILLMNLSKGLVGDINAELLGMIIVSKIQVAAMRRQKIAKEQRKDFFLYIDEFQNFVTDSIESILSEARKYRLGLVLAHQYIDQLEKKGLGGETKLKGAIFGNVGNVLSYKIGEIDAEFMAKVFAPVFSDQDISNLDTFKAIMKLSIDLQPSRPFNFNVQKPWLMEGYPRDDEAAEAFLQLARLKYGRQREFVDQEIRYRIGAV